MAFNSLFHLTGLRSDPQKRQSGLYPAAFFKFSFVLQQLHVLCLPPLGAFDDVERYRLAFFQAAEAVRLNCGEMDEHVLTILTGNKAITFRVIEPLNCSLFHVLHAFLVLNLRFSSG